VLLLRPSKRYFGFFVDALRGGTQANYTCRDGFQTLWNRVMRGRVRCVERSFNCIAQRDLLAPRPSRHCLLGNASVPHVAHFAGRANKPWVTSEGARRQREGSWAYSLWARELREARQAE
jgi:lipopolysaccharide biosynthesis glycosyltransferase